MDIDILRRKFLTHVFRNYQEFGKLEYTSMLKDNIFGVSQKDCIRAFNILSEAGLIHVISQDDNHCIFELTKECIHYFEHDMIAN